MNRFKFELKDAVKIVISGEVGLVIARAEYIGNANGYLVRYQAGDGRATEQWWQEDALEAAST